MRAVPSVRCSGSFTPIDEICAAGCERAGSSVFVAYARPGGGLSILDHPEDAILAGVAATIGSPGNPVVIATTNVGHLSRFPGIDARPWEQIS